MIVPHLYQSDAVKYTYQFIADNHRKNPLIVIPTAGGKTIIIATICRDAVISWDSRVLVLAHVKELLEQSAAKIQALCPTIKIGVYSAGLNSRECKTPVVVAGIQSVHDKADQIGTVDVVIVDEAHLIGYSSAGMYRKLINDLIKLNPNLVVIGLTATPFRTGNGVIFGDEEDHLFHAISYEIGVRELVAKGYLSPLVGKNAATSIDLGGVKVERGEFVEEQVEQRFMLPGVVGAACVEIVGKTTDRKSVLVFCQTLAHMHAVVSNLRFALVGFEEAADKCLGPALEYFELTEPHLADWRVNVAADWLEEQGHPVGALRAWLQAGRAQVESLDGGTPAAERAELIARFRKGELKYLINVGVLTTGFDAPNTDCVCLLRATVSPGLYYQMVGRGFRLSPQTGKTNCLILDFGTNIKRHGPVDQVRPWKKGKSDNVPSGPLGKECPECNTVTASNSSVCPDCGYVFPVAETDPPHDGSADEADPLSGTGKATYPVTGVSYNVHRKRGRDENTPKTLRVTYHLGIAEQVSEWVCVEHEGFAGGKARGWWSKRCDYPMPTTAVEAMVAADHGVLAVPSTLMVRRKTAKDFPEIIGCELGDIPDGPNDCPSCGAFNYRFITKEDLPPPPYLGKISCGECGHFYQWACADTCEAYGFLEDQDPNETPTGMLPAEWFLDRPTQPTKSLFEQIEEYASPNEIASEVDDCPF